MTVTTATTKKFNPNLPKIQKLLKQLNNSWLMKFWFFAKLPSVFFWGGRIKSVTPQTAVVTIPYNWRSQNPFKSTYFAALSGAAELSTGLLATLVREGFEEKTSMLVVDFHATFSKKATGIITFTCEDGDKVAETVERAVASGEGEMVQMISIGTNEEGVEMARVEVIWSFKVKK